MEMKAAVQALAALAHEHRLSIFRLLIRQGPSGLPAGDIATAVAVLPSTLSHHLAQLERAGLLRSWRVERRIYYAVDVEGMRRLLAFLTEDCCQGHPELCGYGNELKEGKEKSLDHHDLSQPEVRDVAECPCDDPEFR